MEVIRKTLEIRGVNVDVAVPGTDAGPAEVLASHLECILLALIAMDDRRVDAVLDAYGIPTKDPRQIFSTQDVDIPD